MDFLLQHSKTWEHQVKDTPFIVILCGSAAALTFAPFNLGYLTLFPVLLFLYFLDKNQNKKTALLTGFIFGLGFFGTGISWIDIAIRDFSGVHFLFAALFSLLFIIYLSLYPALFVYLYARYRLHYSKGIRYILFLPLLWLASEMLRSMAFSGFPWLLLGYSQTDTPLMGYAPLVGVYGISFLLMQLAGLCLYFLHTRKILTLIAFLFIVVAGIPLNNIEWTKPSGKTLSYALIQGNIQQGRKWDQKRFEQMLDTYQQLILENLGKVDVIILPENALPAFYQDLWESYLQPIAERAKQANTEVLIGIPFNDPENSRYYTSLVNINNGENYHKRHLVPFGEYIPGGAYLQGLLDSMGIRLSSFSPGHPEQQLLNLKGQMASTSICYDDAYPFDFIHQSEKAEILINVSNDSWYGRSMEQAQHLQIARMRAKEVGRPMLKATSNGITAFILSDGTVSKQLPAYQSGVLYDTVSGRINREAPWVKW